MVFPFEQDYAEYIENEVPDAQVLSDYLPRTISDEIVLDDSPQLVALYLTQAQYLKIVSSLFTGAWYVYPDEWLEIMASFWQGVAKMDCEYIADCIENSTTVQTALGLWQQKYSTSKAYPVPTLLSPAQTEQNLLPSGYTCDTSHLCGMSRFIVQNLNSGTEELLQQLESQTQIFEFAAVFVDNFEGVSWFGSMLELGTWLQDQLIEYYELAWSPLVEDELACELYCLIEPNCELSIDLVLQAYENAISGTFTLPTITDINDLWDWMLTLDLQLAADKLVVAAFHYVIIQALRFGGKVLAYSFGIRTFEQMVQVGQDETDTYCNSNCACTGEWCYSIPLDEMLHFDWSSASGNQYAGTYGGGIWTASLITAYAAKITAIGVYYTLPTDIAISRVECDIDGTAGTSPGQTPIAARIRANDGINWAWDTIDNYSPTFDGNPKTVAMNTGSTLTIHQLRFYQVVDNTTGTPSGNGSLSAIRIYGTGTPPVWADNC